ncbi:hypothetical protein B0H13DRAFT_1883431 [Mycena leptocephala]|nr:hypothetical protein B0H13DRAFT_1883431 [Mycena leptocephala]
MNRPQNRPQGLILLFVFVSCFRKRLLMIVPSHAGGSGENSAAQVWANAFNLSYAFVFWMRGYSDLIGGNGTFCKRRGTGNNDMGTRGVPGGQSKFQGRGAELTADASGIVLLHPVDTWHCREGTRQREVTNTGNQNHRTVAMIIDNPRTIRASFDFRVVTIASSPEIQLFQAGHGSRHR